MKCGSVALLNAYEATNLFEETPIESGISLMDDVEGYAMLAKDMVLRELSEPL